jgi:hypothetical protein
MEKAAILLPFAKILLPCHRNRACLAMGEPADSALGVNPFLELEGRISVQLPKASGV